MADWDDVCVLIPTLNEAETIGDVIGGFYEHGLTNVLVVDGDSTDGTREIAAERGARVIVQSTSGKGEAVREALDRIETPYVLMVDGDGTYRPEDASAMLEPLVSAEYEHVIGNRFADMAPGAMSRVNHAGNRLINWAFGLIHGPQFKDILSGYRAFTHESVQRMTLDAAGFGIETEMAVECAKRDISTAVVPIRYEPRPDGSETNLRPMRDGSLIILTLYQLARTNNPLFYFGSVGLSTMLVGAFIAAYVGFRWFARGASHEVLALVAGVAILLGFQIVMFGLLSDLIVTLHREQMRRFDKERDR